MIGHTNKQTEISTRHNKTQILTFDIFLKHTFDVDLEWGIHKIISVFKIIRQNSKSNEVNLFSTKLLLKHFIKNFLLDDFIKFIIDIILQAPDSLINDEPEPPPFDMEPEEEPPSLPPAAVEMDPPSLPPLINGEEEMVSSAELHEEQNG